MVPVMGHALPGPWGSGKKRELSDEYYKSTQYRKQNVFLFVQTFSDLKY